MLQDHVKRKLLPYKYPRIIEFLPELPKTGTGKIDRQALLNGTYRVSDEISLSPPGAQSITRDRDTHMSKSSLALGNLRSSVILLVVGFHSALAYLGSQPASQPPFDSPPYDWLAFPIRDAQRWFGFDLFCAFQLRLPDAVHVFSFRAICLAELSAQGQHNFRS
jgi:hypothetical protein